MTRTLHEKPTTSTSTARTGGACRLAFVAAFLLAAACGGFADDGDTTAGTGSHDLRGVHRLRRVQAPDNGMFAIKPDGSCRLLTMSSSEAERVVGKGPLVGGDYRGLALRGDKLLALGMPGDIHEIDLATGDRSSPAGRHAPTRTRPSAVWHSPQWAGRSGRRSEDAMITLYGFGRIRVRAPHAERPGRVPTFTAS